MTGLALALLAKEIPQRGWVGGAAVSVLLIVSTPFGQANRASQASIPVLLLVVLPGRALWRRPARILNPLCFGGGWLWCCG